MNLLATKEGLEKDIQRFEERVAFQEEYVRLLRTNEYETEVERYEALDKAYHTELESLKNRSFIKKFKKSLADVEKGLENQKEYFNTMPSKIKEVEEAVETYRGFLDEVKKMPKATNKQKKEREMFLAAQEQQYLSCVQTLQGIKEGFEGQADAYDGILNDWKTLEQIIKIATGQKAK